MSKSAKERTQETERDFDYGKVSDEYEKYRKPFPDKFFEQLVAKEIIAPGKTILDIGAGTGMIARKIAQIDSECLVTALDCSKDMLDTAAETDESLGITNVSYHCSPAEETGLPDDSFDVIIAGRCWHWFDQDKAIQEIKRIAKPGATLVITHYDPALEQGNPLDIITKLINEYDPTWELPIKEGLEREYEILNQLMQADFGGVELQIFVEQQLLSQNEWVQFFNTTSGVGGNSNLDEEQVDLLNRKHAERLEQNFGEEDLTIKYNLAIMFFSAPGAKTAGEDELSDSADSSLNLVQQG